VATAKIAVALARLRNASTATATVASRSCKFGVSFPVIGPIGTTMIANLWD